MTLFYFIISIVFLSENIYKLVPLIFKKILFGTPEEYSKVQCNLNNLIEEIQTISMTEEFARYAKLNRKIQKEKETLAKLGSEIREKENAWASTVCKCIWLICRIAIVATVFYNRSVVVARIPENWIWPLNWMFCWSADNSGGITVPCWTILSSSVSRRISNLY